MMQRPRVSICIATYNGSHFVREQLLSLLPQLGPHDEIVVFDDGSTDGTPRAIAALGDGRIRLHVGENRGHVRNFERSLRECRGEIIFLCDQDDLWHPSKVDRVLSVFRDHLDVAMVHHERELIDRDGKFMGAGPCLGAGVRGGYTFLLRELVVPRIFGCCLAIRARCLKVLLPFPLSVYAHDHWAGIVGAWTGGIVFLPERLIQHRQHGGNVTPGGGLAWRRRAEVRLTYLKLVFEVRRRLERPQSGLR